jgi:outer membrane biosynthesis protein TonB
MKVIVDAINSQIESSVYETPSKEGKFKLASQCENIKKIAIIAVVVAPVFAFFLPKVFSVAVCLAIGLLGYDIFNMADNLGDAARVSAAGGVPEGGSNMEMLVESTLLAKPIYRKMAAADPQMDVAAEATEPADAAPIDVESQQEVSEVEPAPEGAF